MTVPLEKELKRELQVGGETYTLTISPEGLRLTEKGKRKGIELQWEDLVSGQAALAVALNASLEQLQAKDRGATKPSLRVIGGKKTKPSLRVIEGKKR